MYRFFFIVLFLSQYSFAQNTSINGIVIGKGGYLSDARIINANSGIRTISGVRGEFSIKVKTGDTLFTYLIGFVNDTTIIHSQNSLVINLKAKVINLKEVIVRDNKTSPLKNYNQAKTDYNVAYKRGDNSNMLIVSPVGVGINIDALFSTFSKQGKNGRKLKREIREEYEEEVIDQKFNARIVENITSYKGDELIRFMDKYRPTFEFICKKSEIEVILYIKKCLKEDQRLNPANKYPEW
jgi:hypothetical protein